MVGMRLLEHALAFLICNFTQGASSYLTMNKLGRSHRHEQTGIHPSRQRHTTMLQVEQQGFGEFESLKIAEEVSASGSTMKQDERIVILHDFSGSKPIPYQTMWEMQKEFVDGHIERLKDELKKQVPESQFSSNVELSSLNFGAEHYPHANIGRDSIILLQHEPVYTLGTGSDSNFIKGHGTKNKIENPANEIEIDVVRIERGGEVTYHGPGQLVAYPILDLRGYKKDLHWYMRALEEAIIVALTNVGIRGATREDGVTGVWVNGKKIGAMGVKVKRWVTMHGLAVNVDQRSLANFNGIVPCGLVGRDVCCINDFLKEPIAVKEFAFHLKEALQDVLEVKIMPKN